jgi:hypothetical protein
MTARTVRSTRRQIAATLAFYGNQPMPAPAAPRQPSARPEADVLRTVLAALRRHPAVAWVERLNSGVVEVDGRWIRYGWIGAADLIGQLADGRFLAVEVKAPAGRVSEAQQAFLDRVNAAGGVAFVARGGDDVAADLGQADPGLQALAQARTSRHPSATPIVRQRPASQARRGHPAPAPPGNQGGSSPQR